MVRQSGPALDRPAAGVGAVLAASRGRSAGEHGRHVLATRPAGPGTRDHPSGANLVELAVEDGILAKSALSVPYGNLASMYEQMGEATNATKYAEMANAANPKPEARTGRATPASMRTGATMQNNGQQRQRMSGTRR